MSVMTIEGIVDRGQIRLRGNIQLPDNTKVYVVVPDRSNCRTYSCLQPAFGAS